MISKDIVKKVLNVYEDAWVNQKPEKILTIFHKGCNLLRNVL